MVVKKQFKKTTISLTLSNQHYFSDVFKMNSLESRQKAIAILDVLGFKSHLEKCSVTGVYNLIIKFIRICIPHIISRIEYDYRRLERYANLETRAISLKVINISDSLILYVDHELDWFTQEHEIETISLATAMLLNISLAHGIPLRGAIAFGDCIINEDENVFIGKPFVEALKDEKRQEWVGAIFSKSAESIAETRRFPSFIMQYGDTPIKVRDESLGTRIEKMNKYIINWCFHSTILYFKDTLIIPDLIQQIPDFCTKIEGITGWPCFACRFEQDQKLSNRLPIWNNTAQIKEVIEKNPIEEIIKEKFNNTFEFWERNYVQVFEAAAIN